MRLSRDLILLCLLGVNGLLFTVHSIHGTPANYRFVILGVFLLLTFHSLYFKDKIHQIKTLLAVSFLGDELLLLLIPILFIPNTVFLAASKVRSGTIQRLPFVVLVFIFYSIVVLAVSYVLDFSIYNMVFWYLTFASYLIIFIHYAEKKYREDEALRIFLFFRRILLFQIIIIVLQALIHQEFRPGDRWVGSSGNSIVVGMFFSLLILYTFIPFFIKTDRTRRPLRMLPLRHLVLLAAILALLYFNDSKMIILSLIVGTFLYFFFLQIVRFLSRGNTQNFVKAIAASLLVVISLVLVKISADEFVRSKYGDPRGVIGALQPYVAPYLQESGINAKAVLYKRVYLELFHESTIAWLFGVGPGKFGSKASNTMAYDILYKLDTQAKLPVFIEPYSAKYTRMYMSDLWTESQVNQNKFRSATLSFPFAGLITIKAEYGSIGLMLFLFLVSSFTYYMTKEAYILENTDLKTWAIVLSVFWISLPFHMIFDNFQEKNAVMLPILLLSAVIAATGAGNRAVDLR